MGQVAKVSLSCYLVLLSFDSKPGNKTATPSWPDTYDIIFQHPTHALFTRTDICGMIHTHLEDN